MKNTLLPGAEKQLEHSQATMTPQTATQTSGSGTGVTSSAAPDVARLTLLQDEADELRVSFLGGDMQRRTTSGVPH